SKETRLLSMPAAAEAHYHQPQAAGATQQEGQNAQASIISRLGPVHYIAAGVALLVIIGALVAVPLALYVRSGAGAAESTTEPAAAVSAAEPAAGSPGEAPAAKAQTNAQVETGGNSSGTTTNIPAAPQQPPPVLSEAPSLPTGGVVIEPIVEEKKTVKSPPKTAPQKPRTDSAAAERERRRQEALRALDQ
ncbi:MAG: hypothetical protein WKF30_19545, partial [Pyrinomonadaceae bacterium]